MPHVSIVIPAYNAAKTLAACLDSLRAQTFSDWEAFIIDDVSTDHTALIASAYANKDNRIHLAGNPGKGPSDARNYGGLTLARGDIIAFCDADDLWTPNKLQQVTEAFSTHDADVVFGRVAFFKDNPDQITSLSRIPQKPITIQMLLGENPVCTMSNLSILRKTFVHSCGFDSDIVHNEDLEWLVRIVGTGGSAIGLNETHVFYRTSFNGLSADIHAMEKSREHVLNTALQFGVKPKLSSDAVFLRYLARRALRVESGRTTALRLTLRGLAKNPAAFLWPLQRGLFTAIGAALTLILPTSLNHTLFHR